MAHDGARRSLNGLYECIHLLGGAAVLAQSIAEAKLIEPLVHLDQRAGDKRGLRDRLMTTSSRVTPRSELKASMASPSGVLSTMPPSQ